MFKSIGALILQNLDRTEDKQQSVKPSTVNWEVKVIAWCLENLRGLDLRMFHASMRADDRERKKTLEAMNFRMHADREDKSAAALAELERKI